MIDKEIILKEENLPATIDGLYNYTIISDAVEKAQHAKVAALIQTGAAQFAIDAARQDEYKIKNIGLKAKFRLGELLEGRPKKYTTPISSSQGTNREDYEGRPHREKDLPDGINKKISHKMQTLARNQDQVQEMVQEMQEHDYDPPSDREIIATIKRENKREELIDNLENIEKREAKKIEGVYDVIVIDPPWPMKKIELDCRPTDIKELDYPSMTIGEIGNLKIPYADDCHIFLWTTQKFLINAFQLLTWDWDLKYVCVFVWHKPAGPQPIGLPQYNCEFVIYARKGCPQFIDTKNFRTCFDAPRNKHSEKPIGFYNTIRRVTIGRRLDMFSRREIDGFDMWGKEA